MEPRPGIPGPDPVGWPPPAQAECEGGCKNAPTWCEACKEKRGDLRYDEGHEDATEGIKAGLESQIEEAREAARKVQDLFDRLMPAETVDEALDVYCLRRAIEDLIDACRE